ncbi:hypothetical protein DPM19_11400 [Actinomadura craniellae]|uniref:DUF5667 domain-containing protein n=1 Tax=Actinomadura craniellae TaxID=2231787 RepID=A0A365H872_9ACTN|nr:DUF5667 domain-containing protein [Actinomadura craniellae]RAY15305.1 hypothetical protein DPM19_11400 [Actinomadura craniellae]
MTTRRGKDDPLSKLREIGETGPGPDPLFRELLREQLMAAAERPVTQRPAAVRAAPRRRRPGLAVAAALLLAAGLGGTTVFNAQRSLPGDQFHVVKRAGESARLSLAGSDAARGRRELATARTRTRELARLVDRPRPDSGAIRDTLRDMDDHTRTAAELLHRAYLHSGDRALVTALTEFTLDQRGRLSALLPRLPPAGHDSLALVNEIIERTRALPEPRSERSGP